MGERTSSFPDYFQPGGIHKVGAGIASVNAAEFADDLTYKVVKIFYFTV
jgi:hypothetical protein